MDSDISPKFQISHEVFFRVRNQKSFLSEYYNAGGQKIVQILIGFNTQNCSNICFYDFIEYS